MEGSHRNQDMQQGHKIRCRKAVLPKVGVASQVGGVAFQVVVGMVAFREVVGVAPQGVV